MKFYKTVDQRKKYLENEDFSGEEKTSARATFLSFTRYRKKTVINETKLRKTLTNGSTLIANTRCARRY